MSVSAHGGTFHYVWARIRGGVLDLPLGGTHGGVAEVVMLLKARARFLIGKKGNKKK